MNLGGISGRVCPKWSWSDVFPADNCPRCQSPTKEAWFSKHGKVATFTVIRYPPRDFEKESPYLVALIDIQNGPRVMGRIAGAPTNVQIGNSVVFLRNNNGVLQFMIQN